MNLAETIRETSRKHLLEGGCLLGQCLTAVGWVGGTVPEIYDEDKIIELPTSDSSNSAIACGFALAGKRPIYVIRYQGFLWYNAASLLNYAAKSKEMWNVPCPVFVRALGMEGHIGPVASGMHHSMAIHMPGIAVAAPITPNEWKAVWNYYMEHDDPMFCSEHRASFTVDYELEDRIEDEVDVTIFAISITRLHTFKVSYKCNVINILWLKPCEFSEESLASLGRSKFGLVLDGGNVPCRAGEHVAVQLMQLTGKPVYVLGLDDRTAGFATHCDNLSPTTEKINNFLRAKLS